MFDPEKEFEYEQKCERIAMEIETLILDGVSGCAGKSETVPPRKTICKKPKNNGRKKSRFKNR